MRIFYFLGFVTAFIFLFGLLDIILLKLFNRDWWERRWIRRMAWLPPLVGVVMVPLWAVGEFQQYAWLALSAAVLSALAFIVEISLMLALPISGFVHLLRRLRDSRRKDNRRAQETEVDTVRRDLLNGLAAAVPMAAVATGFGGVARSFSDPVVERKVLSFDRLPRDLEGLRLLHISDTHLRHYVTVHDLERLLVDIEPFKPDLICLIGDIADDLKQLPDALRLVHSLRPPLGTIATLGNHEYFRGVEKVRKLYDDSEIPLFVNRAVRLRVGSSSLYVGGIDDPRRMGTGNEEFFADAIDKTFRERETEEFSVLLSHRPGAFPYAASSGIDLTLAGHTHGGQMGFMGRSLLEKSFPDAYLWGEYHIGDSRLYTSSGVGHWFPFRLGCPPEAPVIELRRA